MDNNNDAFNSLGLDGVTLHDNASTSTNQTAPEPTAPAEPADTSSEPAAEPTDDTILNDLNDEETIDLFVEGLMAEKGVDAPTEEIRQDLKDNLKNQLLREIDRALISELPDDKLEELDRVVAANGQISPEAIAKTITDAGLDVTDIVGTTMIRFRDLYLGKDATEQAEA